MEVENEDEEEGQVNAHVASSLAPEPMQELGEQPEQDIGADWPHALENELAVEVGPHDAVEGHDRGQLNLQEATDS